MYFRADLGKGNPLRVPRCIPSGLCLSFRHRTQIRASKTYRRLITCSLLKLQHQSRAIAPLTTTRKETSLSLHPPTQETFLPLRTLIIPLRQFHRDTFSVTISWAPTMHRLDAARVSSLDGI